MCLCLCVCVCVCVGGCALVGVYVRVCVYVYVWCPFSLKLEKAFIDYRRNMLYEIPNSFHNTAKG